MRSYLKTELKKNAEDMRGFKDFSTCCEIDIMRCEEVLKERGESSAKRYVIKDLQFFTPVSD